MNEYLKRLLVFHLLYIVISIGLLSLSINWDYADVCIYVLYISSSVAWILYAVFLISVLCNYGMNGTDYLYPEGLILSLKRVLLLDIIRILYCKLPSRSRCYPRSSRFLHLRALPGHLRPRCLIPSLKFNHPAHHPRTQPPPTMSHIQHPPQAPEALRNVL